MNTESQVLNVPIEDIIPNRFQPRLTFDENGLKELSDSIKEHGIIQPLVLRRLGDKYEIIAGERRYKAAKMAGLTSVPAIISMMDDKKSAEVAIVENVQRRDLSSIEEAKSYKALLDKGYLTQEELAKKMGLSQSAISNKLRLLSLSQSVQDALMNAKISERHARSLLQLEEASEQDKWLNTIIEERLTVRELDKRLKELKPKKEKEETIVLPSIEEIKSKAEDIVPVKQYEDIIPETSTSTNSGVIPNKYFNFLEDESANMSTREYKPIIDEVIENKDNDIDVDSSTEEEIELLDFEAPVVETTKKDMTEAENLLNELIEKLNSNYTAKLVKDESDGEIKYTIIVDKN